MKKHLILAAFLGISTAVACGGGGDESTGDGDGDTLGDGDAGPADDELPASCVAVCQRVTNSACDENTQSQCERSCRGAYDVSGANFCAGYLDELVECERGLNDPCDSAEVSESCGKELWFLLDCNAFDGSYPSDSCETAFDGVCDEPDGCGEYTDSFDCACERDEPSLFDCGE